MSTGKILSFMKEKERINFERCEYSFSITIHIEGSSFETAFYKYFLEYIGEDEIESALNDVLQALINDVQKIGISKISEPIEPLLNKDISFHYFLPAFGTNNGIFFYEHEPAELTDTQLIVILNNCIANLRQ